MKQLLSTLTLFLEFSSASAQVATVDSLPFTLDNLLITFKVKLNGVEVDAAFDTGAGMTVSNSAIDLLAGIKKGKSKQKVTDANQTTQKIEKVSVSALQIGNSTVNDITCLSADMPYLYCNKLLLLGNDVIKQFNWTFDFDRRMVYVSKALFETNSSMVAWSMKGKKPFTSIRLGANKPVDALIDMGFNGVLDISSREKDFVAYYVQHDTLNNVRHYVSASMGLSGMGVSKQIDNTIIDRVEVGGQVFSNVFASLSADNDTKVGVQFFNRFCHRLILNYAAETFYLALKDNAQPYTFPVTVQVSMTASEFVVTGLEVGNKDFTIGEVVRKVNGKTVQEYANECGYLIWRYTRKKGKYTIEKLDGTIVEVQ